MCQKKYIVTVQTPEGEEHSYRCDDDDVSFDIDMRTGYLFVGAESDLRDDDEGFYDFAVAYAPGCWNNAAQILE